MSIENYRISFYLKDVKSEDETLVLALVYLTRTKKFKISTGIKIKPQYWNQKNPKQHVRKSHSQSNDLNKKINKIKRDYENICLKAFLHEHEITKEYLLHNLKYADKTSSSEPFFSSWDSFIESKKTHCTSLSLRKYNQAKKHLLAFQVAKQYHLSFDSINLDFYEKFTHFLLHENNLRKQKKNETDPGLYNSSAEKIIKCIKTFMNYTFEKGLHTNISYKKFKGLNDNSEEIIALSIEELSLIENLKSISEIHDLVRDLFLMLCYTGIRFSDLKALNGNTIKDDMILITTQKTKDVLKIPVHSRLRTLLNKYTSRSIIKIPEISNSQMNEILKDLGKEAGLNDSCKKIRYKGGNAITIPNKEGKTTLNKWELLTTHTGRRTFTTLSLFLGMDSESVKKITGHKNDRTFKKYVRYSDQQLKQKIKVWE